MADVSLTRLRINRPAVIRVIQTGKPRAWFTVFGHRLVASIKRHFPRGRRTPGKEGRPHAVDTITFNIRNIRDGLQMNVHTTDVRYGTIIERGGKPTIIRGRRGKFLVFRKKSGELRVRPVVRHPGSRGRRPFQRGAQSLGLKVRRR